MHAELPKPITVWLRSLPNC